MEEEYLLGKTTSENYDTTAKRKITKMLNATRFAASLGCLSLAFQGENTLVALASYGLLGLLGVYQSAVGKTSLTRKTESLTHLAVSLASYTLVSELVRLLTASTFHFVGVALLTVILFVSYKGIRNTDMLSSKLTVFNIGAGFVSLFSAVAMSAITINSPMMGDVATDSTMLFVLAIGYASTFLFYSFFMNERVGTVRLTSLLSLIGLTVIMAFLTLNQIWSVSPQMLNLRNDESVYRIMSITHKDQVESICGLSKYAPSGSHKARIWEGRNSLGYLNDDCFTNFKASLLSEASLLFNSLAFGFAFLILASVVSTERYQRRRTFKMSASQKKTLFVSVLSGFAMLGVYFVSLAGKYTYKKAYLAYRSTNVDSNLVFPANSGKWTKIYAKINAERCKYELKYAEGRGSVYYGCTLN